MAHDRRDLELIETIYDCALRPDLWPPTLGELAARLSCDAAAITTLRPQDGGVGADAVVGLRSEFSTRLVGAMNDREISLSVHQLKASGLQIGTVSHCGGRTAYLALPLSKDANMVVLILARQLPHPLSDDFDHDALASFAPHLQRSASIARKFAEQALISSTLAQSLDTLSVGVVHVNADLSVVHANQAGRDLMGGDGPLRFCNGYLRPRSKKASLALQDAIRWPQAADDGTSAHKAFIRLDDGEDDGPFVAYVKNLAPPSEHPTTAAEPVASIFIAQPRRKTAAWTRSFASAFRLTAGEQRVLDLILEGETLADTAEHLGIAISTARTHLRRIFEKSGVSRQPELVKLAAMIAPTVAVAPSAT